MRETRQALVDVGSLGETFADRVLHIFAAGQIDDVLKQATSWLGRENATPTRHETLPDLSKAPLIRLSMTRRKIVCERELTSFAYVWPTCRFSARNSLISPPRSKNKL
jgi:hypothetical protein